MDGLRCVFVLACFLAVAAAVNTPCSRMSNTTCENCLQNVTCMWCNTNRKCLDYPVKSILPSSSFCKLHDARWGICWVNFEALIISMSVVGGVLILSLAVCCCCCCCRKRKKRHAGSETDKSAKENEERKVRQEERRVQMKTRHDDIRKKYGLFKEDNPYTQFDN